MRKKKQLQRRQEEEEEEEEVGGDGEVYTGMKPSNWVAWTILPRRSFSLSMGLLQVLQDDLEDLAYSTFHGFWF